MTKLELDDSLHKQVVALSEEGDALFDQEQDKAALGKYFQALKLLPEPVYEWEAATWLFVSIGDVLWTNRDYEAAYDAFQDALRSPGGIGNPFVHLRVGQLDFELGNREKAIDELLRAYMGGDEKIFEREDPKYFEVIKGVI